MIEGVQIIDVESYCLGLHEAEDRLDRMIASLEDMHHPLEGILTDFHHHTEQWMLSRGDGTYPPLDPSTVTEKARSGAPFPDMPLFDTGMLFLSAIGKGPYTVEDAYRMEAFEALDWEKDGYNIAALHQEGVGPEMVHRRAYTTRSGKHVAATSYMWQLPSRPIFTIDDALVEAGANRIVDHVFQY